MGRVFISSLAFLLLAARLGAQTETRLVPYQTEQRAGSRSVLGQTKEFLAAGAEAIRAGRYEDGIRLTSLGLERDRPTPFEKAAALSNLCAARAAQGDVDSAIRDCTDSLSIDSANWHAYSNRSYAYYLKGLYFEARLDLDAAAALAPAAREIRVIRGLINEHSLKPRIIMEEHR